MSKKLVLFFSLVFMSIFLFFKLKYNINYDDEVVDNNLISMNLEQNPGKGDYKLVKQSSWPTEGYIFNSELSRCENGSIVSWDSNLNTVKFSGSVTDKCYVYFDIYNPTLLKDYVISLYTGTQGDNGIYYHNSSLANGAGDNSYRYAGANPNNFVCFGSDERPCPDDNLYRIIGVIDDKVKLIKWDYANSNLLGTDGDYSTSTYLKSGSSDYKGNLNTINTYYWNKSTNNNTWSESNLNKINLNANYINNIGELWANKVDITTWKVGGNTWVNIGTATPSITYTNEMKAPADNTTYSAKIGLMYVSDYGFAASSSAWATNLGSYNLNTIKVVNWMYMGLYDWTILKQAENNYNAYNVSYLGSIGGGNVYYYGTVRPVFFLNSSVAYISGSGTQTDPIRIK